MGLYLNPGNETFAGVIQNDIYVDKTGLISYMNGQIGKMKHLIASSRPRRFGKTLAAQMLAAYYSKGCDSRAIFENLEIAQDKSFEEHLNKYDVISLDIQWMKTSAAPAIKAGDVSDVVTYIHREVIRELREAYPDLVDNRETSLPVVLANINVRTKNQFVIIIDEWDAIFREDKEDKELQKEYIDFLMGLFKGDIPDAFVKLAYITGILPIKKYGTQSALNNFRELTMTAPGGIARYVGFTEDEVKTLCEQNRASFVKMQKWYDGYIFDQSDNFTADNFFFDDENFESSDEGKNDSNIIMHVYSPNSVMEAINNREFQNYWSKTETYEFLKMYISMDFDGLKQKVVEMLGGKRCKIDVESFQNDMTTFNSSDDVLTLLIHLGYLAYDSKMSEVFIPNEEVRSSFVRAVKNEGWCEASAETEFKKAGAGGRA